MRVLILASHANPSLDEEAADLLNVYAADGGFSTSIFEVSQDLCSALYRDPEAMGVIWTDSSGIAEVICSNWRRAGVKNILFVLLIPTPYPATVEEEINRRIRILGMGADDVQPAPIDKQEFIARLGALSRRERIADERLVPLPCDAVFDPDRGTVVHAGGVLMFTKLEASVLDLLSQRKGSIVTKEMVMNFVYGGRDEPQQKIIDVLVCKIRRKLHAPLGGIDVIQTVWGRGYTFIAEGYRPVMTEAHARATG